MNFAAVIADYNVSHSREPGGKGIQIDTNYLSQLGPQALPAIERALQTRAFDPFLVSRRDSLGRRAAERHGVLAQLGLSKLAAPALSGRPAEQYSNELRAAAVRSNA
jgi:hypothetical protein